MQNAKSRFRILGKAQAGEPNKILRGWNIYAAFGPFASKHACHVLPHVLYKVKI